MPFTKHRPLENDKFIFPKQFRDLVHAALKNYSSVLGLNQWEGTVIFAFKDCADEPDTRADMNVDIRYRRATMRIYPKLYHDWELNGDDEIADVVAHEVCHILTQPLANLASNAWKTKQEFHDEWEALTELISRLALRLYKYEK